MTPFPRSVLNGELCSSVMKRLNKNKLKLDVSKSNGTCNPTSDTQTGRLLHARNIAAGRTHVNFSVVVGLMGSTWTLKASHCGPTSVSAQEHGGVSHCEGIGSARG